MLKDPVHKNTVQSPFALVVIVYSELLVKKASGSLICLGNGNGV